MVAPGPLMTIHRRYEPSELAFGELVDLLYELLMEGLEQPSKCIESAPDTDLLPSTPRVRNVS